MKQTMFVAAAVLAACSGKGDAGDRPVAVGPFRIAPVAGWKQVKDDRLDPGSVMFRRGSDPAFAIFSTGPFAEDPTDPAVCKAKERARRGGGAIMKVSDVRTIGAATGCWIAGDVGDLQPEKSYAEFVVAAPGGGEALLVVCTVPLAELTACEAMFGAVSTAP